MSPPNPPCLISHHPSVQPKCLLGFGCLSQFHMIGSIPVDLGYWGTRWAKDQLQIPQLVQHSKLSIWPEADRLQKWLERFWVGHALPVGLLKPAIPQTKAISFPPHTNTVCKQVALSPGSTSSSHMERCLPHQASACSTLNHFSRPLLPCSTPWSSSPPPLLIVLMPPCKPTTFDVKITTTTITHIAITTCPNTFI